MIEDVDGSYYLNIVMSIILGILFFGSLLGVYHNITNYGFEYEIVTNINGIITTEIHNVKIDFFILIVFAMLLIVSFSNVNDFRELKKEVEEK